MNSVEKAGAWIEAVRAGRAVLSASRTPGALWAIGGGVRTPRPASAWVSGCICLWLLAVACSGWAAEPVDPLEKWDFDAAEKAFQDLNYERAERGFADFARIWVNSARRTEAILLQARARHARTNFTGAIELLTIALPQAGKLADQYQFWLGEARFEAGQFDKAAETYALLVRDFTNSPHRFAAAHNEALARYKLGNQREKVVSLLRDPNGAFQRAAKAAPTNDLVVSGTLLLGEALLAGREFPAAEQAVRLLEARRLEPEVDWQRRFLLGRVLAEAGRAAEALPVATNLVKLASALRQPLMEAESFALQGVVLEQLGELAGAVVSFTNNLSTNAPLPLRHRALTNVVALNARQHKDAETVALLERYSAQFPGDARLDLAQLTLAELRVKEFHGLAGNPSGPAQTNLLTTALTNLNFVLLNFTNSPHRSRAHYQRGWCLWHLGQPAPAAADFSAAATLLPKSEDQAMARFKLAEAQALLNDHSNALRNFQLVVEQYADLERVRNAYFDEALYRAMRSAWAVTNQAAAEAAFRKVMELFPESLASDKATLLHAGELTRHRGPADARAVFQAQLERFPNSPLAPQIHLAVARTYRQDANWAGAARQYEDWLRRYPTNAARADVEFERAFFSGPTGATNALVLFSQFITNHPAHSNAPLAQLWVGDYHLNHEQFHLAEASYQLLAQSTNPHAASLRHLALLHAGNAAYERQGYKDATDYFTQLVNDRQTPAGIQAQAFFALGDTYQTAAQKGATLTTDPLGDAIIAFSRVTNNYPTNPIAARAMGRIGECHYQRAAKDAKEYELAAAAFLRAMTWPQADAGARSLAEVALGLVREKQRQPKLAVEHWSNVLYQTNLQPGEAPDLDAMREAGGNLARLREEQSDWAGAIQIYQRMQQMLPARRAVLQLRIDRARAMLNERR
ncbi:MAG: Tetratricopeptide domain protein [Limisphaerales bacterium]|nr:MAG: Tetratricopeptide domain protein [Limisphaerales bacterium]KAG0507446.1 MAG: Tetratricopeptide domain protein [Limisphaerales bacterium]TXT47929.1 MAG: Tetratricopeptide domain protein [Limisphaerales bacterium]